MRLKLAIIGACLGIGSASVFAQNQKPWDLNDVTYVYSLGTAAAAGLRLSEVLPREVYDQVIGGTGLTPGARTPGLVLTADELYRHLSLVAVRIDPCFRDRFTDPCRRQIRGVWQPIATVNGRLTTVDAAVHTFHDLAAEPFEAVLRALQELKRSGNVRTTGVPLQVHPGLKEKTPFALALGTLLRRSIGRDNTTRIAVMKLMMGENGWRFQGFDVIRGPNGVPRLQLQEIFPGLIQEQQLNNLAEEGSYDSRKTLASSVAREKPDQLFVVANDSRDPKLADVETLKLYLSRSIRVSQPRLHLPGTVDCLSCHASDGVKAVTARALIARGVPVKLGFATGRYNLRNMSANFGSTRSQRGIGYFGDGFQVLDRTILESAEVADLLNGRARAPRR